MTASVGTPQDVGRTCLCLHVQRAARVVGRRFDQAFRPLDLSNGQFSLLMMLDRPQALSLAKLAEPLGMDRTTLTAALKPLERRGLVCIEQGQEDRRTRYVMLTEAGRALLRQALPLWRSVQAETAELLEEGNADRLRADLRALA